MRKTILYLVILGLLGFAVWYFLFSNRPDKPFSDDEAGFTITDTGSIGKIFIASSDGETITVERTDSGWMVNRQYKALPSTLNMVLTTLATQKATFPVTKAAYNNVIKDLSTDATKVEVYDRTGKKMKVIYVGGIGVNNMGTNMLLDGAKRPFVVVQPGFNGYLTSHYPYDMAIWRDRTIFGIPGQEIKTISLQYARKPINSFVLTRYSDDSLTMTGDESITRHLDVFNKRRAKIYVKYFANVNCEGYMNGIPGMDSIIKASPKQSEIDVTGMHGQHQHVDIYWMALNKRSKNVTVSDPDIPDDYDADRLYAVINNGKDTVLIQQWAFRNIFHKLYEFYEKDIPASAQKQGLPRNVMMHKDR